MSSREEKYRYCKQFKRFYGTDCSVGKYHGIMRTISDINNSKKEWVVGLQKLLIKASFN